MFKNGMKICSKMGFFSTLKRGRLNPVQTFVYWISGEGAPHPDAMFSPQGATRLAAGARWEPPDIRVGYLEIGPYRKATTQKMEPLKSSS